MAHHNRSGRGTSRNPLPGEIFAARLAAGLSQTAAAELLHTGYIVWQQWESEDPLRNRRMHPAFWELFQIKAERIDPEFPKTFKAKLKELKEAK